MTQGVAELNEVLRGATLVRRMHVATDLRTGECTLELELMDEVDSKDWVEVRAESVSGLEVRECGGGLWQLSCLRAKDVRDLQHDRVVYELEDLEHRRIFLRCQALRARLRTH